MSVLTAAVAVVLKLELHGFLSSSTETVLFTSSWVLMRSSSRTRPQSQSLHCSHLCLSYYYKTSLQCLDPLVWVALTLCDLKL